MSGTHEHLEHAEHAQHASHSSFDRRVAVTMAIVAALLAGLAMLSHRLHNDTLLHSTNKGQLEVQESNAWSQYQAKRMRQQMDRLERKTLALLAVAPGQEKARDKAIAELDEEELRYKKELADLKTKAEGIQADVKKAKELAHHAHLQANWMDFAHLAMELGLVLSSLAVLTKRKPFWFAGMAVAILGLVLATYAMVLPHHAEHPTEQTSDH